MLIATLLISCIEGAIAMRRFLSAMLMIGGLSLVAAGLGSSLGSAPQAQAQPRPTLTPAPSATPVGLPTRTPSPRDDDEQPAPTGRITGTVIDLTTGAPAPGIAVLVGDATTTSDANGNYDRAGLAPGRYVVALALRAEQGTPAQEPIAIDLGAGATIVQHLSFHSPLPAPAATPTAATPPTTLPVTSGAGDLAWPLIVLGLALLLGGGAALVRR
jgi:hypothetical protein